MSTHDLPALQSLVESVFADIPSLSPGDIGHRCGSAVEEVLTCLESGTLRVAEPDGQGGWRVNDWVKKAVLLYFRLRPMEMMPSDRCGVLGGFDKVPLRFTGFSPEAAYREAGARVVPGAIVRRGATSWASSSRPRSGKG